MCSGMSAATRSEHGVFGRLLADLERSVTARGTGAPLVATAITEAAGRRWRWAAAIARLGSRMIGR